MADSRSQTSKLFLMSIVEVKDELDERLEKCHAQILAITRDLSEREASEALQAYITKGPVQHEEIQNGFLYAVLSNPKMAAKSYRDMTFTSQDGLQKVVQSVIQLIYEKWTKLNDTCRTQLTWLTREMVHSGVRGADTVCQIFMRQIAGGDISPKNIWLTETVLDILTENRLFLEKCPLLLPTALYTYLRVIVDHGNPQLANLRQREVDFCVSLMREKWSDCMQIGRDLIRLLQGVARILEFNNLWKDILTNPSSLSPQFTGVKQLLQMKTSRTYFTSRLTPDMETKLGFLTKQVRFGQQRRYQDWFQRQYLSTPESQSLRCDLIRYICAVIHPSNDQLCSDIIPRWAVIGWLLTTCTSNVAASNAKLALFYDWLFFDTEKDNIMNIEPCILVMHNSMRPHPAITATLLDFMCRIMSNFYPPLTSLVRQGIFASLQSILDKRVLPSLSPLFDNQKLDKELHTMLRDNFSEFCVAEGSTSTVKDDFVPTNNKEMIVSESPNHLVMEQNSMSDIAEFSDDDDVALVKLVKEPKLPTFKAVQNFQPVSIQSHLEQLDSELRGYVLQLQEESDKEAQCEVMERLLQVIIREEFDQEDASTLAACLCQILGGYFEGSLLPQVLDDEAIEDSIGSPMFVILRNICQTPEEDQRRQTMMMLLEEMYKKQPRIGYHFLYFLKVSKVQNDERMSSYKDFCKNMEQSIETYLMNDLRLCQNDDVRLFVYLVPDIYSQFPSIAVGNVELIHLIVSCIDGTQLQDLICEILQGHLVMFGSKESFLSVLNASLGWETIEQYFLWQLISVHTIPVEHIMPILPRLDFAVHAEALSSIMILLKQDCPSPDLLRPLLCRECKKNDLFTVSLLKYWAQEYEDRLADLLHAQLTRSNGTPNKRKHRPQQSSMSAKGKEKDQPTTEQILSHLDHMRLACRNISFLTNEIIQQALQYVQTSCSDALKAKYGDLLALVEDFEEMKSTRVLRQVPSRRANQAATKSAGAGKPVKKTNMEYSESSSESSDDDDVPKSKKMKRFTVDD